MNPSTDSCIDTINRHIARRAAVYVSIAFASAWIAAKRAVRKSAMSSAPFIIARRHSPFAARGQRVVVRGRPPRRSWSCQSPVAARIRQSLVPSSRDDLSKTCSGACRRSAFTTPATTPSAIVSCRPQTAQAVIQTWRLCRGGNPCPAQLRVNRWRLLTGRGRPHAAAKLRQFVGHRRRRLFTQAQAPSG
jgi:hypothetical protein